MYFGVDYYPEQWVFPYGGTPDDPEAQWEIDAEMMDFIIQFPESDLEKSMAYTTTQGKSHINLFQHMFTHLLNHSTYHRGQLASLLRQAGAVPNATDLILYYRQVKTPLS